MKYLRAWKAFFVIAPIVLGGLSTWPLLAHHDEYKWFTGVCALLAGFSPAISKALDFDVSLKLIAQHAHEFKILQDRFRQAWRISALGSFADFKKKFDGLMTRMDAARAASLTPPERFFKKAQAKIGACHYDFAVDTKVSPDTSESGACPYRKCHPAQAPLKSAIFKKTRLSLRCSCDQNVTMLHCVENRGTGFLRTTP